MVIQVTRKKEFDLWWVSIWDRKQEKFDWHKYLLDAIKNGKCKKSFILKSDELVVIF